MNKRIRLLLIEDRPSDAELILHELRRAGYEPEWTRVETEPDYLAQLDQGWEIILADYNLPQFTGLRALELLNERGLAIPFIIVSGTIGEERAVQAMKDGASDYVMKDRLARLGPAVVRALREAALRRESKRAGAELRAATQLLASTVQTAPDAIMALDPQGRVILWNPAAERIFGWSAAEIHGQPCPHVPPEKQGEFWSTFEGAKAGSPVVNLESQRRRKDGSLVEVSFSTAPLRDAEGRFIGAMAIFQDITERKRTESQLKCFASLGMELSDAKSPSEAARTIVKAAAELLGWDACYLDLWKPDQPHVTQLIGMDIVNGQRVEVPLSPLATQPSPMMRRVMAEGAQLILRQGPADEQPPLVPFGDTARRSQSLLLVPVRHGGQAIGVLSVQTYRPNAYAASDLSTLQALADHCAGTLDRLQAEEALRENEERLRVCIETTATGFVMVDANGCVLDANLHYAQLAGYEKVGQILGRSVTEWTAAYDQARNAAEIKKCVASGVVRGLQVDYVHPDGVVVPIEINASILGVGDNLRVVTLCRDITERKRGEVKIREQAALLDQTSDAILVRTLDGLITFWNKGAEHLLGWTSQEMLGRNVKETQFAVVTPEKRAEIERHLLAQGYWAGEIDYVTKTGHTLIGMARTTVLRDAAGAPQSFLSLITDLTEQKKLEDQFLRAQRLEAVGTLAGGVAHDLNNILAPILMGAPMLRELPMPAEMASTLDAIESSAQRGTAVVRQLLTFSRGQTGQRIPIHLKHLLRDLHHIIGETFPKNITFTTSEAPDLWPLVADPTQLHQVLLNLCVNARDAMPEGGTLVVTAANFQADDQFAAMTTDARLGPYVHLQVSDTGTGIPSEHLEKIFDPFFTTKEVGQGTGLGLATVQRVVSGHGGLVRVHSQMGKGATFHIYLPAAPEAIPPASPALPTARLTGHGELILVVDDEGPIRRVTQQTLTRYGYRAVTAGDGTEAVSLFAQHQTEVRAVLTDLMMPGLDGLALVKILARMAPTLPVVISTGLGSDPSQHEKLAALERLGVTIVLTKPYTADDLLNALHAALSPP